MLKYCLIKNALDDQSCVAVLKSTKTVQIEEFLNDMVDEGTGLTRPLALAYFERMTQLTRSYLEQGFFVSTPLFRYRASISGKFTNLLDTFDDTRHTIKITSTPGPKLRKSLSFPHPVKVGVSMVSPTVLSFVDSVTDATNSIGSPGETAMIEGTHLQFDKRDPLQGVFFVAIADANIEHRATNYSGIKPSTVHLRVPEVLKGDYKVVVRNMSADGRAIVTGSLHEVISF